MIGKCSNLHRYVLPQTDEATVISCWQQFIEEFPTDGDCLEELYRRVERKRCTNCGSRGVERKCSERVIKCRVCKNQTSLTAGTFFHRIKKFQAWLGAIWLMEQGVCVNPFRFCQLAGIAYATAHNISQKLSMVIESYMSGKCVSTAVFAPVIGKRSRETPARAHPVAEEEEMGKRLINGKETNDSCGDREQSTKSSSINYEPDREYDDQSKSEEETGRSADLTTIVFDFSEHEKGVFECLSEEPEHFDSLYEQVGMSAGQLSAILIMLELKGHVKRIAGDHYVRLMVEDADIASGGGKVTEVIPMVDAVIDFIRSQFHGISRKYLQNYLAALWCLSDRVQWPRGSLLKACLKFRYLSYGDVIDYVSPPLVKISLCAQE